MNEDRKNKIKTLFNKVPCLKKFSAYITLFPPGHYYSPIPSREEILKKEQRIFGIRKKEIDGINLNEEEQLKLLEKIKEYYNEILSKTVKKIN